MATMQRLGWGLAAALVLLGCEGERSDEAEGSMDDDTCEVFVFEYEGAPEDGVCPRLECCPGQLDGNFSAFQNGMCLSSADCEAVCADPDAAFSCL
jgi:hypothetical protein